MTIHVHIDGETFSSTDIKHGLERYFSDEYYRLLMLAWAVGDGPVQIWDKEQVPGAPPAVHELLTNPDVVYHAYNAPFEWQILRRLGYDIPLDRFHCTMARAYAKSFNGKLHQVQDQIGIPEDQKKLETGRKLIKMFCTPAPTSHKVFRYSSVSHPEEWAMFLDYCKQDVVAERSLDTWLDQYPEEPVQERRYWLLDHRINQRGMLIDVPLVNAALATDQEKKRILKDRLKKATGLDNPTAQGQFLEWLQEHYDATVENVRKETLIKVVEHAETVGKHRVAEICKIRMEATKTSNAKWKALKGAIGKDARLRNAYQFGGAQRTKRWAGRIVQPHNLPSSMYDDLEEYVAAVESIMCRNPRLLDMIWGNTGALLSQSIRGAIHAEQGNKLVVSDLSSVESRGLGWLANCPRINSTFAQGLDTYKDFATELFGVRYEDVTKAQRKFSKPPVLGCGYMLGWRGLVAYADGMGVEMSDDQAKHAVEVFRSIYGEVTDLWDNYHHMVEQAILRPGEWYAAGRVRAGVYRDMLLIQLPSTRFLFYYMPRWEKIEAPWSTPERYREIWAFTYMGVDQNTQQWKRVDAHPGKITENIDQAICRDKLAEGLEAADLVGLNPIGHVHDEVICETPEDRAETTLDILNTILATSPWWGPDFALGAEGWIGNRYMKQ